MINAYWEALTFQIQEGTPGEWRRVVDTSLDSPYDLLEPGKEFSRAVSTLSSCSQVDRDTGSRPGRS